eukprot:EG_transcript_12724
MPCTCAVFRCLLPIRRKRPLKSRHLSACTLRVDSLMPSKEPSTLDAVDASLEKTVARLQRSISPKPSSPPPRWDLPATPRPSLGHRRVSAAPTTDATLSPTGCWSDLAATASPSSRQSTPAEKLLAAYGQRRTQPEEGHVDVQPSPKTVPRRESNAMGRSLQHISSETLSQPQTHGSHGSQAPESGKGSQIEDLAFALLNNPLLDPEEEVAVIAQNLSIPGPQAMRDVRDMLVTVFSSDFEVVDAYREFLWDSAKVYTSVLPEARDTPSAEPFARFFLFSERLCTITREQAKEILLGSTQGVLHVTVSHRDTRRVLTAIRRVYRLGAGDRPADALLLEAAELAWQVIRRRPGVYVLTDMLLADEASVKEDP